MQWIIDTRAPTQYLVFEADTTRYELLVTPDPENRGLMVSLVNFGRCARIGRNVEEHYLSEKLDVSLVDARNILEALETRMASA